MKHLKTYERFQGAFGEADIIFKNDTYLVNVTLTDQEGEDVILTVKVNAGDKLENVSVDYVDDIEKIVDISGFSLTELLQEKDSISKIEAMDYPSYILESNVSIFYKTNEKNGSVTSVSYEDIEIIDK